VELFVYSVESLSWDTFCVCFIKAQGWRQVARGWEDETRRQRLPRRTRGHERNGGGGERGTGFFLTEAANYKMETAYIDDGTGCRDKTYKQTQLVRRWRQQIGGWKE
jgi:hypothetical protein